MLKDPFVDKVPRGTIVPIGRVPELVVIGPLVETLDDGSPDSVGTLAESVISDPPVDKPVRDSTGKATESVVIGPSVEKLMGGRTVSGCVGILAGSLVVKSVVKPPEVNVPGMRTDLLVVRIELLVNKPLDVMLLGGRPDTLGKLSEPVKSVSPDVRLPGGRIACGSPMVPVVIGPLVERLRPVSLDELGKMVVSEPPIDERPVPRGSPVPVLLETLGAVKGYKELTGVGSPPDGEVFLAMELNWPVEFGLFEVSAGSNGSLVMVVKVLVPLVIILV